MGATMYLSSSASDPRTVAPSLHGVGWSLTSLLGLGPLTAERAARAVSANHSWGARLG